MAEISADVHGGMFSAEEVKEKTEISQDFYTVFSNHTRIAVSPTEVRLFFGENYPTAKGEIRFIEDFCVVITPAQAKLLAQLMAESVQKMETVFGPIPDIDAIIRKSVPAREPAPHTES